MTTSKEYDDVDAPTIREEYESKMQEALKEMREQHDRQLQEVRGEVETIYERQVRWTFIQYTYCYSRSFLIQNCNFLVQLQFGYSESSKPFDNLKSL